MVAALGAGEVLLLENLRFHAEEEKNDPGLRARSSRALADVYVNDAFGAAHRAHASTARHGAHSCRDRAAGFLLAREVEVLSHARSTRPKRPFVAILGGAKVSDKIGVIEHLLDAGRQRC